MAKKTENAKKLKSFKSDLEREAAVVLAVQNIGVASIEEIIEKVEYFGGKVTEKQVEKACENLQKRQIFSINLNEKDKNGNIVKRYNMRQISVSVPEVGQIKAIVDGRGKDVEVVRALIDALEASKKNAKIAPNNYYEAVVKFRNTYGKIYGYIPDGNGTNNAHYRDSKGRVVFFRPHFRAWLKKALALANKYENSVLKIYTFNGATNITKKLKHADLFVGNTQGLHNSGGKGSRKAEYLEEGSEITTKFRVPESLFTPDKFKEFLELAGESVSFGGCSKVSNNVLELVNYDVKGKVWAD